MLTYSYIFVGIICTLFAILLTLTFINVLHIREDKILIIFTFFEVINYGAAKSSTSVLMIYSGLVVGERLIGIFKNFFENLF